MFTIKKFSASGVWEGQITETFDDKSEAAEYLSRLAERREKQGYDVSTDEEHGEVVRVDLAHDNMADAWTYVIDRAEELSA